MALGAIRNWLDVELFGVRPIVALGVASKRVIHHCNVLATSESWHSERPKATTADASKRIPMDRTFWGLRNMCSNHWLVCRCLLVATILQLGALAVAQDLVSPPSLWTRKQGSDWPDFLGPGRQGRSSETGINADWSAGLPILWQRELGEGYSSGVVSHGRFFQFDRHGDRARLTCLHAENGTVLWTFEYKTNYVDMYGYDGGPRCSPVVDQDRVYLYGVEGMLHCLRVTDGKLIWKCDTFRQFGVVQNFFGVGSTPIIEGELLLAIVGGSPSGDQGMAPGQLDRVSGNGSGIVAFEKLTGKVRYQITDELASYSSPITATIAERRWCFALCRGGLVAFEPRTGAVDFQYSWRATKLESVNASTPVVAGDEVFISETYGPGSVLLAVRRNSYQPVWRDDLRQRQKTFQAHWSTPIYVDGYLYGCSGRNTRDAEMRCIKWSTGEVMWSERDRVHSSLMLVDGYFVCLEEYGRLRLMKVNAQQREIVAELDLGNSSAIARRGDEYPTARLEHPCWAAPVLAHGLLYVRGRNQLLCLELTGRPKRLLEQ